MAPTEGPEAAEAAEEAAAAEATAPVADRAALSEFPLPPLLLLPMLPMLPEPPELPGLARAPIEEPEYFEAEMEGSGERSRRRRKTEGSFCMADLEGVMMEEEKSQKEEEESVDRFLAKVGAIFRGEISGGQGAMLSAIVLGSADLFTKAGRQ